MAEKSLRDKSDFGGLDPEPEDEPLIVRYQLRRRIWAAMDNLKSTKRENLPSAIGSLESLLVEGERWQDRLTQTLSEAEATLEEAKTMLPIKKTPFDIGAFREKLTIYATFIAHGKKGESQDHLFDTLSRDIRASKNPNRRRIERILIELSASHERCLELSATIRALLEPKKP